MVVSANDRNKRVMERVQNGNLSVNVDDFIGTEEFNGSGRLFGTMTIPPKGSIGYHVHTGETETYYIVSGEGKYSDNGKEVILKAGDVTFTANGCGHGIENIGDSDLVFIALILFDKK